uniref:AlNc14C532G12071 protein n=1 Tax=Albugo laibachii Nc14 TaxID=890382 RepID=F0X0Y1_9STRA|nr:AlNc14C532G12071 [Albugo laibachii Nc14]|eukprot:CCA27427.1 AlNc14C532G12071 [Albugo laibachii Nc14]
MLTQAPSHQIEFNALHGHIPTKAVDDRVGNNTKHTTILFHKLRRIGVDSWDPQFKRGLMKESWAGGPRLKLVKLLLQRTPPSTICLYWSYPYHVICIPPASLL